MGRKIELRGIIGVIKDKASISKATLFSNPNTTSPHLAVLRATTHDTASPTHPHHISALLSFGLASRATASSLISALMDRLHRTASSAVALKSLLAVHHIIRGGTFILHDQLAVFPAAGGRNHLKLSEFRDAATPTTWELSSWVRFYARFLEQNLSTARVLGFFLCSSSSAAEKDKKEENVTALTNSSLIREIESLVSLIEEIRRSPDPIHDNKIVYEVVEFVGQDYLSAVNEVSIRVCEFKDRLGCLSFGDSVELVCVLNRLEDCKERLSILFPVKKASSENLWGLVREIKERVGSMVHEEEARLGKRECESTRFGERVLRIGDSVMFSSSRMGLTRLGSGSRKGNSVIL